MGSEPRTGGNVGVGRRRRRRRRKKSESVGGVGGGQESGGMGKNKGWGRMQRWDDRTGMDEREISGGDRGCVVLQ